MNVQSFICIVLLSDLGPESIQVLPNFFRLCGRHSEYVWMLEGYSGVIVSFQNMENAINVWKIIRHTDRHSFLW